jgi:hypothetical protein
MARLKRLWRPRPWRTARLAIYGGVAGLIWAIFETRQVWFLGPEEMARATFSLFGGFTEGAAAVAFISGLRNLLVRAR